MERQQGHEQRTGLQARTRPGRKWIRRIALGLAVTAIMAPTADAIGASSTGSGVRYLPTCGPMGWGGAPDWVGGNPREDLVVPVCGPLGYGGVPDSVVVDGGALVSANRSVDAINPLTVPSNEPGIDWRDAGAGVGIGATLGLLAAGAALALKRRRRGLLGA